MQAQHNYYLEKGLVNFGLGALWSSYGVICSPWGLWPHQITIAPIVYMQKKPIVIPVARNLRVIKPIFRRV